jgi:translation initiation factor 4E
MGLNAQSKDPSPTSGNGGGQTTITTRPRLAASALRTGSSTSVATTSTIDSTAVNFPNTRSASPSALSASSPHSETQSVVDDGGDALTSERLEKHNQENPSANTIAAAEKKPVKVGYKNIPSLDAITARLVKTRQLSVDGTAKPPEAPMIEDPKTPGVQMRAPEHPLQFPWYVISSRYLLPHPADPR